MPPLRVDRPTYFIWSDAIHWICTKTDHFFYYPDRLFFFRHNDASFNSELQPWGKPKPFTTESRHSNLFLIGRRHTLNMHKNHSPDWPDLTWLTVNATGFGFDPHSRKWNIHLKSICSFLRSGAEAKRSVEFRHSAHNVSRIQWKVGNVIS